MVPTPLASSVIQILTAERAVKGAGFVVAGNLAVTCAHVVREAGGGRGEDLRIRFFTSGVEQVAQVLAKRYSPVEADDVAFLRLDDPLPEGIVPVALGLAEGCLGHDYAAVGFPNFGDYEARWSQGKLGGVTPVKSGRKALLQLQGDEIARGCSGGPVLDLEAGYVVGMITEYKDDTHVRFAYATTIETLSQINPAIRPKPAVPESPRTRPSPPLHWAVFAGMGLVLLVLAIALWSANPLPTATLSFTVAPTLTLTPTAMPTLQVVAPEAFREVSLYDVAAANGVVWFATTSGLFYLQESDEEALGDPQPVPGLPAGARTLLVEDSGTTAWFIGEDGQAGQVSVAGEAGLFAPIVEGQPRSPSIAAFDKGPDGAIWLIENSGQMYRQAADGVVRVFAPPDPPLDAVEQLAVSRETPVTLWAVGFMKGVAASYRWQELEGWAELSDACVNVDCSINAVASDTSSRAWFGHSKGITLFSQPLHEEKTQRCAASETGLLSEVAADMALAEKQQALWLITRAELARLDIAPRPMPGLCQDWHWDTWREDGFWQEAVGSQYQLAVDEGEAGNFSIVWLIQAGTNLIRRLPWRP